MRWSKSFRITANGRYLTLEFGKSEGIRRLLKSLIPDMVDRGLGAGVSQFEQVLDPMFAHYSP